MQGPASVLEDGEVRRSSKRRDSTSGIKKIQALHPGTAYCTHAHAHTALMDYSVVLLLAEHNRVISASPPYTACASALTKNIHVISNLNQAKH